MTSCIDAYIRPDQTVPADSDTTDIKHRAVIIRVEIIPDMNINAEIAVEIISYKCPYTDASKQVLQDMSFFFLFGHCKRIQPFYVQMLCTLFL